MLRLLRLKYVFAPPGGQTIWTSKEPPLPRLLVVRRHTVLKGRDDQLRALASPGFDPRQEVLLEETPEPAPEPSATTSTARIVEESTDHLTIVAELPAPGILLITDVYHPYWRVTPLSGSAQSAYRVLPADYVLRAVPLGAGRHHFRMEYRPPGFTLLCWIFGLSWTAFFGAATWLLARSWFRRPPEAVSG